MWRINLVGSEAAIDRRAWSVFHACCVTLGMAMFPSFATASSGQSESYLLGFSIDLESKEHLLLELGVIQLPGEPSSPVFLNVFAQGGKLVGGVRGDGRIGWLYPMARNTLSPCDLSATGSREMLLRRVDNRLQLAIDGKACLDLVLDPASSELWDQHTVLATAAASQLQSLGLAANVRETVFGERGWSSQVEQVSYLTNRLTTHQTQLGWKLLWDGVSTAGWRGARLNHFPEKGWQIQDGVLSVLSSGGAESRNGGDIITTDEYTHFDLEVDFRLTPGANSGIKYFVLPNLLKEEGSAIGLEFQILDDQLHPDAKKGLNGNRTVGSLYDLIPAENQLFTAEGKPFVGVGRWNRARVRVCGLEVEHWLNNQPVVRYQRSTQMFRALVSHSKYAKWQGFGEAPSGPILLQDHGDLVSFRSIKIRPLTVASEGRSSCK